jgi:hypothetical protein
MAIVSLVREGNDDIIVFSEKAVKREPRSFHHLIEPHVISSLDRIISTPPSSIP